MPCIPVSSFVILKIQVAADNTEGVIVQKSIMKQKKGKISKLTNTTTNPWMKDTRFLNNSGILNETLRTDATHSGVLVDDSGSYSSYT
jgi:hypothetical protein